MKNLNVSPAAAAKELIRRRRQALIERFENDIDNRALRLKGCCFTELDKSSQVLVGHQAMRTLTWSELDFVVALLTYITAGRRLVQPIQPGSGDHLPSST
jgi:hypothetical protein